VATVTDDARLFEVPKLRVCALKFTETARARIVKVRPRTGLFWWGTAAISSRCWQPGVFTTSRAVLAVLSASGAFQGSGDSTQHVTGAIRED
jgi:hypothetical protein